MNELIRLLSASRTFSELAEIKKLPSLFLKGVNGSLMSFILNHIFDNVYKKIIFISYDADKLIKIKDDLDLINGHDAISILSESKAHEDEPLSKTLTELSTNSEFITLIINKDLEKKVISKEEFKSSIFELHKDEEYLFEELTQNLDKFNYVKKDFVEEPGDYSIRGGIVDVYPESYSYPVRIDFFGDTIDSIREFDITTQRSLREVGSVKIGMNLSAAEETDLAGNVSEIIKEDTIFDYFPEDALVIIDEPDRLTEDLDDKELFSKLTKFKCIYVSAFSKEMSDIFRLIPELKVEREIDLASSSQPDFHSNLKMLYNDLCSHKKNGFEIYITCSDDYQAKRIKDLIEDFEDNNISNRDENIHKLHYDEAQDTHTSNGFSIKNKFNVLSESIHNGFIYEESKVLVYTEHQIFGRYFKQIKKRKKKFKGLTFNELKELKPGDYVVHRDFGIGIYAGLNKIKVGTSEQEVVKLSYAAGDTVFINLNYINLIKKYSGNEGYMPKLTRLGGGEWDKIKERTKKQVKDIARDLILLYAKRKSEKGFAFSPDTHWQRELEASFMYEDTPDQFRSTNEVKEDMETETPMDRLVCGDVGFGKTEVAIRAAFKAVLDNKQVAILVPTTILAVQHYNTFRDRLSPFAVDVDVITRMKSKKEQKEILAKLEEGKINILIGTHRILSKDIKFRDLGLLIIDEEQRFGVAAKEKLRSAKSSVDTLTLTATPIPRTLNFSLLGARDLSVINTPPKNRKPIQTEIIPKDWNSIAGILKKEIDRKGQVYFVNDRITNLPDIADTIKMYVPNAKIGIAHGQMEGRELEDVVIDFIEKKLNILVCTKIIESGLDIPNVNTIIINNADRYGLSELYQLRGRVGRSDVQAFAYFISPPSGKLTKQALKRLQAIEEFTELGSGFNLAMRDMEIRGVGNLLGKEQSGFIQQVGFDMFMNIIDEAVSELKEGEFKELFEDKKMAKITTTEKDVSTAVIDSDVNALIPESYIVNDTERLNIYRRLYEAKNEDDLNEIAIELKDRFGAYGEDTENLLKMISLKLKASLIGIDKITMRGDEIILEFPKDKEHPVFSGSFFTGMIDKVSADRSGRYNIGGDKAKLNIEYRLKTTDDKERLSELESLLLS
jgi:transcription-repair coupling factor (superfamily II helicase)